MVSAGDTVELVKDSLAKYRSATKVAGEQAVLNNARIAGGDSIGVAADDRVILLSEALAQKSAVVGGRIIDDWNDGDLKEYTDFQGAWDVVNSPSIEEKAARVQAVNNNPQNIHSGSGLDFYPSAGDSFEAHLYCDSSVDDTYSFGYLWCLQNPNVEPPDPNHQGYATIIDLPNREIQTRKYGSDGSGGGGFDVEVAIPSDLNTLTDQWIRLEIDHDENGDIYTNADVYEGEHIGSSIANDTEYTTGGWGMGMDGGPGAGETAYIDLARRIT